MTSRERVKAALSHEVDAAHDGESGLKKIEQFTPDLVVLDVMMPETDGWEVCKILKDSEKTENIPVIMLTAVSSQVKSTTYSHYSGMETQADEYLAKPVEFSKLEQSIKRLIR